MPMGSSEEIDLINFDSLSSPAIAPAVDSLSRTPPRDSLNAPLTVDDLLAPSPLRSSPRAHVSPGPEEPVLSPIGVPHEDTRRDLLAPEEGAQVLIMISDETQPGVYATSSTTLHLIQTKM